LFIFPDPQLAPLEQQDGVITDTAYIETIRQRLATLLAQATGSSNRIERALVLANPPSVKDAEITAKGSLNHSAILRHRARWLDRLYDDDDRGVILLKSSC